MTLENKLPLDVVRRVNLKFLVGPMSNSRYTTLMKNLVKEFKRKYPEKAKRFFYFYEKENAVPKWFFEEDFIGKEKAPANADANKIITK